MLFFLFFLGGFAFYLFWEAGSRYAFPYTGASGHSFHAISEFPGVAGGENVCPENPENAFEWQLVQTGDKENEYYILMGDKTALTYSLEDWTVRLGEFPEGDNRQIWTIAEGGKIFAQ